MRYAKFISEIPAHCNESEARLFYANEIFQQFAAVNDVVWLATTRPEVAVAAIVSRQHIQVIFRHFFSRAKLLSVLVCGIDWKSWPLF